MSALDRRASIGLLTGAPGCGKSYSAVRYIFNEWLPHHEGRVYTTIPLVLEDRETNGHVQKGFITRCREVYGMDEQAVRDRLIVIPEEVAAGWRGVFECDETTGENQLVVKGSPEEYFEDVWQEQLGEVGLSEEEALDSGIEHPLAKALVVLDEASKCWPGGQAPPKEFKAANMAIGRFLATIRHNGARVIFICQDPMQIGTNIRRLVAFHIFLVNLADRREPLTGALIGDWIEFAGLFLRRYLTITLESEELKQGSKMVQESAGKYWLMTTYYFDLYRSRNIEGTERDGEEEKFAFERLGAVRFLGWLLGRNWWNWGWRSAVAAGAIWFFTCVGFGGLYRGALSVLHEAMGKPDVPTAVAADKAAVAGAKEKASVGLEDQNRQLIQDLRAERERVQELEARLGDTRSVVLIDARGCVFANGDRYEIGEEILFGRYRGERVVAVDLDRLRVRLASGVVLRVGRMQDERKAVEGDEGEFSRSLRSSESGEPSADGARAGERSST